MSDLLYRYTNLVLHLLICLYLIFPRPPKDPQVPVYKAGSGSADPGVWGHRSLTGPGQGFEVTGTCGNRSRWIRIRTRVCPYTGGRRRRRGAANSVQCKRQRAAGERNSHMKVGGRARSLREWGEAGIVPVGDMMARPARTGTSGEAGVVGSTSRCTL